MINLTSPVVIARHISMLLSLLHIAIGLPEQASVGSSRFWDDISLYNIHTPTVRVVLYYELWM